MATGYLANGEPFIEIGLAGALTPPPKKLACLIDTGFTGFLSIPLVDALPFGLILSGTTSVVFANGTTEFRLTCLGVASIDGQTKAGVITLEPQGTNVLLGMDFLRVFGLQLRVDPSTATVELSSTVPPLPAVPSSPSTS